MANDFSLLVGQPKNRSDSKKYSKLFWFLFWTLSFFFLSAFALTLEVRNNGYSDIVQYAGPFIEFLPTKEIRKKELKSSLQIFSRMANGKEKSFIVLFQDSEELLPGGGRTVAAGFLKTKDERVISFEGLNEKMFDLKVGEIRNKIEEYSEQKKFGKEDGKLEFKNERVGWSPFFPVNAKKTEEIFISNINNEKIDGVLIVSEKVLVSFLDVVGPVFIEGHEGEYNSENVSLKTEYYSEVEQVNRRKKSSVINEVWRRVIMASRDLSFQEKKELGFKLEKHLNQKDVMIYFNDRFSQKKIRGLGWDGDEKKSKSDYLMIVDANLISKKTDPYIARNFEYEVDLRSEKKIAKLKISYHHSGRIRDWVVSDYKTYLRVYSQKDSWLNEILGANFVEFEKEGGKKSFGTLVEVPLGKKMEVEFYYDLPKNISADDYELIIQKQSGIEKLQGTVRVIQGNGKVKKFKINSSRDVRVRLQ